MASFTGWLGPVSGHGVLALSGGAAVTPLSVAASVDAITTPRVRFLGTVVPRRLQFAGSFGFSYNEPDALSVNRDFVVWERVLNWEYMDIPLLEFIGNGNQATHLWYRLTPGVSFSFAAWLN